MSRTSSPRAHGTRGRVPRRPGPCCAALALGVGFAALMSACAAAAPPRTVGTTTTTLLSTDFCGPIRALATELWADTGTDPKVVVDLEAARDHAPAGVQPVLDELLALERQAATDSPATDPPATVPPAAVPPATGATDEQTRSPQARRFSALNALADVAERECGVDLAAGAPTLPADTSTPGSTVSTVRPLTPGTGGRGDAGLTFDAVLGLVRAARPDAPWLGSSLEGTVGDGNVVQVDVEGIDDAASALAACEDLVAVLPTRADLPRVTVRSSSGRVLAVGEAGSCFDTPRP